jgi:hypothetical protein
LCCVLFFFFFFFITLLSVFFFFFFFYFFFFFFFFFFFLFFLITTSGLILHYYCRGRPSLVLPGIIFNVFNLSLYFSCPSACLFIVCCTLGRLGIIVAMTDTLNFFFLMMMMIRGYYSVPMIIPCAHDDSLCS